jgi:hypothetical protein
MRAGLRHRGFLIHFSHYDPSWIERKTREEHFDLRTGLDVVDAMADLGMNLLVVDIEDGVVFEKHPELRRRYSVPMAQLETLARAAHERAIDVVPKLNFSKSHRHLHDEWLRPHTHLENWLEGRESYWRTAPDVIAEAVRACKPRRFFRVGMDEDHSRSLRQYVEDIRRLRRILQTHGSVRSTFALFYVSTLGEFAWARGETAVIGYQILTTHQVAHAMDRGFGPVTLGWVFAVGGGCTVVGNLFGGWLSDRRGRRWVFAAGSTIGIAGIVCLASLGSAEDLPLLLLYTASGLGFGMRIAQLSTIPADVFGGPHLGKILGVVQGGGGLGGAIGPWLARALDGKPDAKANHDHPRRRLDRPAHPFLGHPRAHPAEEEAQRGQPHDALDTVDAGQEQ